MILITADLVGLGYLPFHRMNCSGSLIAAFKTIPAFQTNSQHSALSDKHALRSCQTYLYKYLIA